MRTSATKLKSPWLLAVIRFFDTAQGKPQGQFVSHPVPIASLAISQDGIAPDRQVSYHSGRALQNLLAQCKCPVCFCEQMPVMPL